MTTIRSSVQCLIALFYLCFLASFTYSPTATQLQGKWSCDALIKQIDSNTVLQKQCLGDLDFTPDHKLNSTCSAGFFPSGTMWKINGDHLSLADSYGTEFVKFQISKLDNEVLILEKNSIAYSFARTK